MALAETTIMANKTQVNAVVGRYLPLIAALNFFSFDRQDVSPNGGNMVETEPNSSRASHV